MKLSIVIPCYNEALNIPLIVARLAEIIGTRDDVEVVLVDNGSTDNTADVMHRQLQQCGAIRAIKVPVNKGYGFGILQGLEAATGDVLSWTHADMQTDPRDVLTAFELYKENIGQKVIVKGKRQNRRFLEVLFTFGMQVIASAALRVRLNDVNAQPKLFAREFYQEQILGHAPHDFSLDLFLLYQARTSNYRILEVPVYFAERIHGEAKGGGSWKTRIKLVKRTFAYIFALRRELKVRRSQVA